MPVSYARHRFPPSIIQHAVWLRFELQTEEIDGTDAEWRFKNVSRQPERDSRDRDRMDLLKTITLWLAAGTEAAASLIIALATIEAVVRALRLFLPPGAGGEPDTQGAKEEARLKLGRWLALALEFELAADILRTAVAPTWDEIGQLAAIAALRTLLNYFLQKEIDKAQARHPGVMGPAPLPPLSSRPQA